MSLMPGLTLRRLPVTIGLLSLTLGGCASAPPADPFAGASPELIILVENQSQHTMRLVLVRKGFVTSLGRVEAYEDGRFTVPRLHGRYEDFKVIASVTRMNGEAWTSPDLLAGPTEQVYVIVRNHLPLSTAMTLR